MSNVVRAGTVVKACATPHDEASDRLPGETQARPKVRQIGRKGRAVATVDIHFRAGIGDAAHGIGYIGIEVLQAVKTLGAPCKDVQRSPAVMVRVWEGW